jgi:hypothetical protein
MSNEMKISLQQAIVSILAGTAKSIGYHKTYFADLPDHEPNEMGWINLDDGDHNARIEDDVLYLELWQRGSFPESAIIDRRVLRGPLGESKQVKVRAAVALLDVAYLHIGEERIWVEDTMSLLDYDPGTELKRKELKDWESAWETYIAKLNRVDDLKAAGRYGYQLRQPYKAVGIAAMKLKQLDAEFCRRLGII